MAYSTCPSCGLRIGSRDGIGPTKCPRCMARRRLERRSGPRSAPRAIRPGRDPSESRGPGTGVAEQTVDPERWIEQGPLSLRMERDPPEHYVIEFYGEFDLAGVELAARELRRCAETDVEEIIVDLSGLDFIDSSGLHVLVQSYTSDRRNGNRFRFLRGPEPVQRVMEVTCLDTRLPFVD
jgi:anti-sigma B factor antagonist